MLGIFLLGGSKRLDGLAPHQSIIESGANEFMTLQQYLIHAKHFYTDGDIPFSTARRLAELCDKLKFALDTANASYVGSPEGQKQIDEALKAYEKMKL